MKIFKPIKAGLLLLVGLPGLLVTQSVMADAGDIISNTVTVDYTTGSTTFTGGTAPSATVRFLEDRQVNLTVTETSGPGSSETGGLGDQVVLSFSVANTSNTVLDFSLATFDTTDPHGGTDNYNQPVTIFVDSDNDDTFDADDVTAALTSIDNLCSATTTSATTPNLNANGSAAATVDCSGGDNTITVFVVTTSPAGITGTDGQISAIALAATATAGGDSGALSNSAGADNTGGGGTAVVSSANQPGGATDTTGSAIDTVFADDDSGAGAPTNDTENVSAAGTPDVARNGIASDADSFIVSAANISLLKTVETVFDPVNCTAADVNNPTTVEITACAANNPKAIPGAIVQYSIVVDNDGTGVATAITVADTIPTGTTFVSGTLSIVVNGTTQTLADPGGAISVTTMDIGAGSVPLVLQADNSLADGGAVVGDDAENDGADLDEALVTFRAQIQ